MSSSPTRCRTHQAPAKQRDGLLRSIREQMMDFQNVGRARLMIRWPQHSKQISDANFPAFNDLMEAYGIAVLSRDEVRGQRKPDPKMLEDYETLCQQLEGES